MKKYITAIAIILIATTTLTKAQNAPVITQSPVSKFTDLLEGSISGGPVGAVETTNGAIVDFRNVLTYDLNNQYSVGIGIGYETYGTQNSQYLPVSADLRWYLNQKIVTPFLNLSGGYAFNLDKQFYGFGDEVFTGLNLGVRILTKSNTGIEFALGLKYEHNYYQVPSRDINGNIGNKNYFYVPLTFGLVF